MQGQAEAERRQQALAAARQQVREREAQRNRLVGSAEAVSQQAAAMQPLVAAQAAALAKSHAALKVGCFSAAHVVASDGCSAVLSSTLLRWPVIP